MRKVAERGVMGGREGRGNGWQGKGWAEEEQGKASRDTEEGEGEASRPWRDSGEMLILMAYQKRRGSIQARRGVFLPWGVCLFTCRRGGGRGARGSPCA